MTIYNDYFLSGGVLFMLLTDLIPGRKSAREHQKGLKDACNEKELMYNLSMVLCGSPSTDKSFESQKTKYKKCEDEGGWGLPFNDPTSISSYDSKVKNQYKDALKEMAELVDSSINTSKAPWFVKAVFDLMDKDQDILPSTEFYALASGKKIKKEELLKSKTIELEPLLVGIWHFILTKRRGENYKGKRTLGLIYELSTQRKHTYTGNADKWDSLKKVTRWEPVVETSIITEQNPENDTLYDRTDHEVIADQVMKSGIAIGGGIQISTPTVDAEKILAAGKALADAFAAHEKKVADDIRDRQETTFVDKQVNGNITQVHMVNNGSGNQAYIVQGDFIVNRGSDEHGKK